MPGAERERRPVGRKNTRENHANVLAVATSPTAATKKLLCYLHYEGLA